MSLMEPHWQPNISSWTKRTPSCRRRVACDPGVVADIVLLLVGSRRQKLMLVVVVVHLPLDQRRVIVRLIITARSLTDCITFRSRTVVGVVL